MKGNKTYKFAKDNCKTVVLYNFFQTFKQLQSLELWYQIRAVQTIKIFISGLLQLL